MKAKDIRKGKVIMYNGAPHSVMDFQHRTPGNLRAFVQMKLRNLMSGTQTETRFSSTEDLTMADVYDYKATYLYSDSNGYHFMNTESYEQVALQPEFLGDANLYLQDGMEVQISTFEEKPIAVQLPKTVILEITETQPEMRGATASNSPKPATTNTGLTVSVPPFLKVGDKIIVDTEEGIYLSRAE